MWRSHILFSPSFWRVTVVVERVDFSRLNFLDLVSYRKISIKILKPSTGLVRLLQTYDSLWILQLNGDCKRMWLFFWNFNSGVHHPALARCHAYGKINKCAFGFKTKSNVKGTKSDLLEQRSELQFQNRMKHLLAEQIGGDKKGNPRYKFVKAPWWWTTKN